MGSVIEYIECPHCKTEAYSDFYYKTGEEYINCQNCGYHYSATYKHDSEGKYITKDGTENYEFDNLVMETNELKNPYGAYRIKYYNSVAIECGSIENETKLNNLRIYIVDNPYVELCTVSRFIDGEIKVEHIVDNGPKVDGAGFMAEDRDMDSLPF